MNIDPATKELIWGIGIMSTLLAAGVSAIFQLLNGWRERIAADKRHMRDLALRAAIAQWEHEMAEAAKPLSETKISPIQFDLILIRKLALLQNFSATHLTATDIDAGLKQMDTIVTAIKKRFP